MTKKRKKTIITAEYKKVIKEFQADGKFILLTGKAGTGKSTLIRYLLNVSKGRKIIKLAPTGTAALNIGGQTIHSFFKLPIHWEPSFLPKFDPNRQSAIRNADAFIIDEISMVRADIMDKINISLQYYTGNSEPFGGKTILAVGDLGQLAPIVDEREHKFFFEVYEHCYFFASKVFTNEEIDIKHIKLTKVFRQTNEKFMLFLDQMRENQLSEAKIKASNNVFCRIPKKEFKGTTLSTTKVDVDRVNQLELNIIDAPEFEYNATIKGQVLKENEKPIKDTIILKVGARVILCKNTAFFKNGEAGVVTELDENVITVKKDTGKVVDVVRENWDFFGYDSKGIANVRAVYNQMPVILGWAITVHKSQGMSLDGNVMINIGRGCFAVGQLYTAFSRVVNPETLYLAKPFQKKDIITDENVKIYL